MKRRPRINYVKHIQSTSNTTETRDLFSSFDDKDQYKLLEYKNNLKLVGFASEEIDQTLDITIKSLYQLYVTDTASFNLDMLNLTKEIDKLYLQYYDEHAEQIEADKEKQEEKDQLRQDQLERLSSWDEESAILRTYRNGNGDLIGN